MPLFRFHRGGLAESLETTIIVKDFRALMVAIIKDMENWKDYPDDHTFSMKIAPYPSKENNFDKRIGWFTQCVTANLYEPDKYHVIGFLSEPLGAT